VSTLEALSSGRPSRGAPAEPAAAYRGRLGRFWSSLAAAPS
jgi:hypothetical protein